MIRRKRPICISVFVEMAGLRSEVRTESRLVKEALDQFRGVFDTLRASQATLQQELDRARAETRDQAHAALRPLLLDVIDLRDRLVAALKLVATARPRWLGPPVAPERAGRGGVAGGLAHDRASPRPGAARPAASLPPHLVGQPFDPRRARVIAHGAGQRPWRRGP